MSMARLNKTLPHSEWGWRIFESFEKYAKLPGGGYAALRDVTKVPPSLDNRMDTFFLVRMTVPKFHSADPTLIGRNAQVPVSALFARRLCTIR